MSSHIELPADAVAILSGKMTAFQVGETLHTAYWLHGRDNATATFMLNEAHCRLQQLADEMGYTLTPKPVAADDLKSEWAGICEAMNRGAYNGTEADALARIDAIKAELAMLEAAA